MLRIAWNGEQNFFKTSFHRNECRKISALSMGAEGRVKHAQTWEWGPPLEPVEILISSRGTSKETALCLNVTTLVWAKYVHCPLALQAEHSGQYLQCHVCLYAAMSSSKKCIEIFGSERLNPGCDIQWSINNWPCLVYTECTVLLCLAQTVNLNAIANVIHIFMNYWQSMGPKTKSKHMIAKPKIQA